MRRVDNDGYFVEGTTGFRCGEWMLDSHWTVYRGELDAILELSDGTYIISKSPSTIKPVKRWMILPP